MGAKTANIGITGRILVYVGVVPIWIEQRLPDVLRRSFGARIFWLAAMSIVIGPALAVLLFDDVLLAAGFISLIVAVTGFLGYCEMYRTLRAINANIRRVDEGEFDISFETDRIDEVGETYTALVDTAASLGETIEESREAQRTAERVREEAEREREQSAALVDHLEAKANAYSERMSRAADGDLSVRLDADSENEAMVQIADSFNEMLTHVESTIQEIQGFAQEVADASGQANAGVREVKQASEDVSDSIQEISSGTAEQREMLDEVVGEMNDLSATVEEVAASAQTVAETSHEMATIADDGETTAQQAIEDARDVQDSINTTVENIEALDEQMVQIGEIADLISDIADQTNMLALNANIEAARAGQGGGDGDGDGFAVVANEVKELAQETQTSANEIEQLIADVQKQTERTVEEGRTAEQKMRDEVDAVRDVVGAFTKVAATTEKTDSGVQEISDATDDQAASAEEAVVMVEEVADISETTAAEAEDVSAAAEEQASSMTQVGSNVESLTDRAERLQTLLDRFEVGGAAVAAESSTNTVMGDGGRHE